MPDFHDKVNQRIQEKIQEMTELAYEILPEKEKQKIRYDCAKEIALEDIYGKRGD